MSGETQDLITGATTLDELEALIGDWAEEVHTEHTSERIALHLAEKALKLVMSVEEVRDRHPGHDAAGVLVLGITFLSHLRKMGDGSSLAQWLNDEHRENLRSTWERDETGLMHRAGAVEGEIRR